MGMRARIPSKETQRRTITLYIDKTPFKESLGITDEGLIHLFLVTESGTILFSATGEHTEEKAKSLQAAINLHPS